MGDDLDPFGCALHCVGPSDMHVLMAELYANAPWNSLVIGCAIAIIMLSARAAVLKLLASHRRTQSDPSLANTAKT